MKRAHRTAAVECQSTAAALARLHAVAPADDEAASSALLDQLVLMSAKLARQKAKHPSDVLTKINLWRVMASEDARSYETATPDEALALSIMDDCERLWGPR